MAWEWLDNVDELIGAPATSDIQGHTWNDILNTMNVAYTEVLSTVIGIGLNNDGSGIYYLEGNAAGINDKAFITTYNLRIQIGDNYSQWAPGRLAIQKLSEPMLGMTMSGNMSRCTWRFMVNYATEEMTAWRITQYEDQYCLYENCISIANKEQCALWYDFLVEHSTPPVTYQWSSVPAISGKNGILSLTTIKDELLGDGSPVSRAGREVLGSLSQSLNSIVANMTKDQTVDLAYSGDTYKVTITMLDRTVLSVRLDFYTMPTTPGGVPPIIYSYSTYLNEIVDPGEKYLGFIIDRENEVAALNMIKLFNINVNRYVDYNVPGATMSSEDMHNLFIWLMGSSLPENWDDTDGLIDDEGDGGGDENPDIYNPIPEPGLSQKSAYNSGFMSQYLVTETQLKNLCKFLWSDNFVENVKKFFSDPRQIIMGLTIFPLTPDHAENATEIAAGGITTGINGYKITKQFQRYDFGYCEIPRKFSKGIFYDYSPYTEAKIYLPFCGEHSLSLNDIMGHKVHLKYTVDHVSGVCCAHLMIDEEGIEECHYNFTGQMGMQIPISSEDFGGFYRSMISAGAVIGGTIGTIAGGGLAAPMAASVASSSTANLAQNITNMGRDVQFTSGGGSVSGGLSSEYPYITLVRPKIFKEGNQRHYTGYPVYGTYKLKDCSGYTKIMGIHLDGLSCTESERQIIRDQLSSGVVIQQGDELPTPSSGNQLCKIMLLTNLSDVDTIGKKFYKSNGEVAYIEIKSDLVYNQNYTKVGLLINQFDASCNYVYIPSFGRCYYVDSVTIESGAMSRLDLVVDAAESFWSELKECEAMIEYSENESKAKYMINNSTWFMKQKKDVRTYMFKQGNFNSCFDRSENGSTEQYILTIAGDVDISN